MSTGPASAPNFIPLDAQALRTWPLPGIDQAADKEARGSVLVVAGSREVPGAALLSAQAAARAGSGKLLIAAPVSAAHGIALAMPEARVIGLREERDGSPSAAAARQVAPFAGKVHAMLVGPGLPDSAATTAFVLGLLPCFAGVPVVLDAAAMDAVRHLGAFHQPVLMTPHCGEMAHLTGHAKEALADNADAAALHYAREWRAVLAVKGATSWIAQPDGQLWRHAGGHPGLATSGSGDVLAGLVAGLAARGATLTQACAWGVLAHALAGQGLAERVGPLGFLARELLPAIPAILNRLQGGTARAQASPHAAGLNAD
jgi:ADP-dependent NAD(P)H-hydrate dehydratase